jgi:Arc/MetJ-type ribon-helix-helix transcriptional regulator
LAESEKLTININVVDLGQMDLLVEEGFYANRTDFLRSAIRRQIDLHSKALQDSITRQSFILGVRSFDRAGLEGRRRAGERLAINVIGMVVFSPDIPPELARDSIASIKVLGVLRMSEALREALADRML